MADSGTEAFKFPSIYDFPPFFTRQVNEQTWQAQLRHWDALILAYCKHHKIFRLDLNHIQEYNTDPTNQSSGPKPESDLFRNNKINRALKVETLKAIIKYMITQNHAEWVNEGNLKSESKVLVYFRQPEEWASLIHEWINSTGQNGTVLTFFELTESDEVASQEFYELDPLMLRKAISVLVQKGQAALMKGSGSKEVAGVKML